MQQTSQPLEVNEAGHLVIGGVDSLELANQYQTPLVAYDVTKIRDQIRRELHLASLTLFPIALTCPSGYSH